MHSPMTASAMQCHTPTPIITTNNKQGLSCVSHPSKCFTWSNYMVHANLITPILQMSTERLRNLPQVTQPVRSRIENQAQAV